MNKGLQKIFRVEDDKLVLINQRLKQTGKLDHAIRVSLLLLYGYLLIDKKQIQRSLLNEVLNHAKLFDGNLKNWIAKCDEITKLENGNVLELSVPGSETAKKILMEFLNPAIEKGKIEFSGKGRKRKKKSITQEGTATTNDKPTPNTKISNSKKSPLKSIEELIQENYFSSKRQIKDIITYLKDNRGLTFSAQAISMALLRLIKNKDIKREKNSDSQYEYHK